MYEREDVLGAGKDVDNGRGLTEEALQAVALLLGLGAGGLGLLVAGGHARFQFLVERLQLLADEHLLGHVVGEVQYAVDLPLGIAQRQVESVDVHQLPVADAGKVEVDGQFEAISGLAGGVHLVEAGEKALFRRLRHGLRHRAPKQGMGGKLILIPLIDKRIHVGGAVVGGYLRRQVH